MIQCLYLYRLSRSVSRRISAGALLASVVVATGCIEKLPSESLIVDTRVLGARVEADDDATRAWPKPGESAAVSLQVVNPSLNFDRSGMQSMAVTCTRAPYGNGPPICLELVEGIALGDAGVGAIDDLGELFKETKRIDCDALTAFEQEAPELFAQMPISLTCAQGEPHFELSVEAHPKAEEKLLLGVTCDAGKAYLDPNDPELFGCKLAKGGRKELWSLTVPLQTGQETNHHPAIEVLYLDGKSWAPIDPQQLAETFSSEKSDGDLVPCAQAADDGIIPRVTGGKSKVKIGFKASGFESYRDGEETQQEQLWVSHYTTSGELERTDSVLKESDKAVVEVRWTTPKKPPAKGQLVRFFFTVRDRRGGFDSTERALCVINK